MTVTASTRTSESEAEHITDTRQHERSVSDRLAALITEVAQLVSGDSDFWCVELVCGIAHNANGTYDDATYERAIAAGRFVPHMRERLVARRAIHRLTVGK